MKRNNHKIILLFVILALFNLGFAQSQSTWEKVNLGISESEINTILVHPHESSNVFVGTKNAIYRSLNEGNDFHSVLSLPGSSRGVNEFNMSSEDLNAIYAATDAGLFQSSDRGETWQRIFYSNDPQERQCFTVLSKGEYIYLGTSKGFFYKKTSDATWQKERTAFDDQAVYLFAQDQQHLYVATKDELFRIHLPNNDIRKIFSLSAQEQGINGDIPGEQIDSFNIPQIKSLVVLPGTHPQIYLATINGIYRSLNQGESWQGVTLLGLPQKDITSLTVVNEQEIWAGTHKGVFRYENERWSPVYQGMETTNINYLTNDSKGNIYAATDRGIFFMAKEKTLAPGNLSPQVIEGLISPQKTITQYQNVDKYFESEPTIQEIQKIAIEYAEVHPNKIRDWRNAAKKRAWLPTLSVGLDRATTELFHWDSGGNPDVLRRGRDFMDWDVSLSWNLGDLVWSTDQTTIDSRSKLMVELREDILDQITRLYFERRRLQIEILMTQAMEPPLRMDKEMRILELTALLDAFTGGQFSQMVKLAQARNTGLSLSNDFKEGQYLYDSPLNKQFMDRGRIVNNFGNENSLTAAGTKTGNPPDRPVVKGGSSL